MSKSATKPYLNARGVLHGMCRYSKGEIRIGKKNKLRKLVQKWIVILTNTGL